MYFRVLLHQIRSNQSATTRHRTLPEYQTQWVSIHSRPIRGLKGQPQVWERDYDQHCNEGHTYHAYCNLLELEIR